MKNLNVPQGHSTVMPYLIIPNADKFLDFIKDVFDAEEKMKVIREGTENEIMHAEVTIGDNLIMLGNSGEQWQARPASLFIYVKDGDATYQKALERGATSLLPMEDKDYGRSGGVEDPFGNVWWITSIDG